MSDQSKVSYEISASADDGHIAVVTSDYSSSATIIRVGVTVPNEPERLWWRWQNVIVPRGSEIVYAYIRAYVHGSGVDDYETGKIYFDLSSVSPSYPTSAANYNSRAKTTNFTNWYPGSGGWKDSPNCNTPLQEVINQDGWVSGNAVQCLLYNTNSGASRDANQFRSYDYSGAYNAELHIEFKPPGGSPAMVTPSSMFV